MASNVIYFENPRTGQLKEAPVGFSWTTLFFGPIPMLVRGSWKWFLILLIVDLVTFGIAAWVFPFLVNKYYIKELISEGFKPKSAKIGSVEQVMAIAGVPMPI